MLEQATEVLERGVQLHARVNSEHSERASQDEGVPKREGRPTSGVMALGTVSLESGCTEPVRLYGGAQDSLAPFKSLPFTRLAHVCARAA